MTYRLSDLAAPAAAVRKAVARRGVGLAGVDEELAAWYLKYHAACAKVGIPLRIVSGFRSFAEQERLKARGYSKAGAGHSAHNFGMALDIIHTVQAYDLPRDGWVLLNLIAQETARKAKVKIRWGGDWNGNGVPVFADPKEGFWDAAHFELLEWKKKAAEYYTNLAASDFIGKQLDAADGVL